MVEHNGDEQFGCSCDSDEQLERRPWLDPSRRVLDPVAMAISVKEDDDHMEQARVRCVSPLSLLSLSVLLAVAVAVVQW